MQLNSEASWFGITYFESLDLEVQVDGLEIRVSFRTR